MVLSPSTVGQVEIDKAHQHGSATPTVWRLPDEGSAALVMRRDATQVLATGRATRWPAWYRRTASWWQGLGRSGNFHARVLPALPGSTFAMRLLSIQLSDPSGRRTVLVSAGMRKGRRVCYSAAPLPRGAVEHYPFVVAACRYPGSESRPGVLLHGFGSRQDRAVPVVVQGVAPDGRLIGPAFHTRVRDLDHGVWMPGVPRRAIGVVVTAVDGFNTLPAFAWTASLSSLVTQVRG